MKRLIALILALALLSGCGDDCRTRAKQECETITTDAQTCAQHAKLTCGE